MPRPSKYALRRSKRPELIDRVAFGGCAVYETCAVSGKNRIGRRLIDGGRSGKIVYLKKWDDEYGLFFLCGEDEQQDMLFTVKRCQDDKAEYWLVLGHVDDSQEEVSA